MLGEIDVTAENIRETSQQKFGCFGADIWLCAASRGLELFQIWWLRECAVKAWLVCMRFGTAQAQGAKKI
jgi:hypothetical protein